MYAIRSSHAHSRGPDHPSPASSQPSTAEPGASSDNRNRGQEQIIPRTPHQTPVPRSVPSTECSVYSHAYSSQQPNPADPAPSPNNGRTFEPSNVLTPTR